MVPAVTQALDNCRAAVKAWSRRVGRTRENLCQPLAEVDDVLGRIFSPVSHLNSVKTARSCVKPTNKPCRCSPSTAPGRPARRALQGVSRSARRRPLCRTEHRTEKSVDNALRDFELSGIGLPKRSRFATAKSRRACLSWVTSTATTCSTPPWAGRS